MFTVLQYKSDVEYLHSRLGKNIEKPLRYYTRQIKTKELNNT